MAWNNVKEDRYVLWAFTFNFLEREIEILEHSLKKVRGGNQILTDLVQAKKAIKNAIEISSLESHDQPELAGLRVQKIKFR